MVSGEGSTIIVAPGILAVEVEARGLAEEFPLRAYTAQIYCCTWDTNRISFKQLTSLSPPVML